MIAHECPSLSVITPQDILRSLDKYGPSACPVDLIAFHPFTDDPAKAVEMMQFAYNRSGRGD